MTELYLIAHKVRGEAAFDIAHQCTCSVCNAFGCHECNDCGYWWIIPTSGHRAYPYFHVELNELCVTDELLHITMPQGLPDHYQCLTTSTVDLITALGIKPKPSAPIPRRF